MNVKYYEEYYCSSTSNPKLKTKSTGSIYKIENNRVYCALANNNHAFYYNKLDRSPTLCTGTWFSAGYDIEVFLKLVNNPIIAHYQYKEISKEEVFLKML